MCSRATVRAGRMSCTTVVCLMAKLPALGTLSRSTYILSHWKLASSKSDMSWEVRAFESDFSDTGTARRVSTISENIGDHPQNRSWAVG